MRQAPLYRGNYLDACAGIFEGDRDRPSVPGRRPDLTTPPPSPKDLRELLDELERGPHGPLAHYLVPVDAKDGWSLVRVNLARDDVGADQKDREKDRDVYPGRYLHPLEERAVIVYDLPALALGPFRERDEYTIPAKLKDDRTEDLTREAR